MRVPMLPENRSKNQIDASKDEINAGSHKEADLAELEKYFKYEALGEKIENMTAEVWSRTQTMG